MNLVEIAKLAIKHEKQLDLLGLIAEVEEQIQVTKDPDHKFYKLKGGELYRSSDLKQYTERKERLIKQYKSL